MPPPPPPTHLQRPLECGDGQAALRLQPGQRGGGAAAQRPLLPKRIDHRLCSTQGEGQDG